MSASKVTPAPHPAHMHPALQHTMLQYARPPHCTLQLPFTPLIAFPVPRKNDIPLPACSSKGGPCSEAPPQAAASMAGTKPLQLALLALGALAL